MSLGREFAVISYQLFSRLFINKTTGDDLRDYIAFIEESSPQKDGVLSGLHGCFKELLEKNDISEVEKKLGSEYTRLFHLWEGVRPYESVYRGQEPLLIQEPWVRVKKFYAERGWYMDQQVCLEDHVAVEMSFMAHLLAGEEWQDAKDFFQQHLGRWAPKLMSDVCKNRHTDFYREVASYCLSFLEGEEAFYEGNEVSNEGGEINREQYSKK